MGRALVDRLRLRHDIIALSRSPRPDQPAEGEKRAVRWRECDLFSLLDAERGIAGADYVVYLVHSMMPSARLTQGSFEDFDLITADNVARAAKLAKVKQVIYLGGLVDEDSELSPHLASRLEVERTFQGHGLTTTTLRAGLVLGPGGSSTEMMVRLVKRLPAMLCPAWTQTRTQPIALRDVVALIEFALGNPDTYDQSFDVGTREATTYIEMMQMVAAELGLTRRILPVPLMSVQLSRLWVSLITGAPKALVQPLIGSLECEMVVRERRLHEMSGIPGTSVREALRLTFDGDEPADTPHAYARPKRFREPSVRSVQRLPKPRGATGRWVASAYGRWLPHGMRPLFRVRNRIDGFVDFYVRGIDTPLLRLFWDLERSTEDRPLFYIRGGLLAQDSERGRLEFRETTCGDYVLSAIHDFHPRLPWPIYVNSQARVHLWVMQAFGRWLARVQVPEERIRVYRGAGPVPPGPEVNTEPDAEPDTDTDTDSDANADADAPKLAG